MARVIQPGFNPVPDTTIGASALVHRSDIVRADSEPSTLFRPAPLRRVQRNPPQSVCLDNETRVQEPRKIKQTPEKACISKQFLSKFSDRLLAVKQDRHNMQKAVQEQAYLRGEKDVHKLEWYDFPGCQKKYVFNETGTGQTMSDSGRLLSQYSGEDDYYLLL